MKMIDKIPALSSSILKTWQLCPEKARQLFREGLSSYRAKSVYAVAGAQFDELVKEGLKEKLGIPCGDSDDDFINQNEFQGIALGSQLWEEYQKSQAFLVLQGEGLVCMDPHSLLGTPKGLKRNFIKRPATIRPDELMLCVDDHAGRVETLILPPPPGELPGYGSIRQIRFDCVHDFKTAGVVAGRTSPEKGWCRYFGRDGTVMKDPWETSSLEIPGRWGDQLVLYASCLGVDRIAVDLVYPRPEWECVEVAQYRCYVDPEHRKQLEDEALGFWTWAAITEADEVGEAKPSRSNCYQFRSRCEVADTCEHFVGD